MSSIVRKIERVGQKFIYDILRRYRKKHQTPYEKIKTIFQKGNLLFIHFGGPGEAVLVQSAFQALQEALPNAKISVFVRSDCVPLIKNHLRFEDLFVYNKKSWFNLHWLLRELRLRNFDIAVDFDKGDSLTSAISSLWSASLTVGFQKSQVKPFYDALVPDREQCHFLDGLGDIVERITGNRLALKIPPIDYDEKDEKDAHDFIIRHGWKIGESIGITLSHDKNAPANVWDTKNYAELATRIVRDLGRPVTVIWSKNEKFLLSDFEKEGGITPGIVKISQTHLTHVAALMKNLACIVGTPSTFTHIADAMGTPVIALCRGTTWDRWRPLGEKHRSIRCKGENLNSLTVDEVVHITHELLQKKDARTTPLNS